MCKPEILYRQHLLGSHVELHILIDHLNQYHNTIAIEMWERGLFLSPFHFFMRDIENIMRTKGLE